MSGTDAVIQIEGLTKRYGEFTALDGLSMQVGQGQILGLSVPTAQVKPQPSRYWWVC